MRKIVSLIAIWLLVACQQTTPPLDTSLPGYDPSRGENQRQECLDRGGRYEPGGLSGIFVCYENTRDANKSCSKSTDCEGYCLARSRTCAPIIPLIGCNEVLDAAGARSTLCLE